MAHSHNHDIRIECLEKSACAQCGAVVDLTGKEAFTIVQCPRCQGRFTAPGRLGNLALLKVLGKGQMGVTFKAYDRALGRSVAVKVMRTSGGADRKAIDDFFSEARALGVLDHPNVAKIYSLVEDPDCPYIVMELLEGGSMDKHFDKNRPMDEVRALEIGMGVAKALSAAHEVGLIHGDVKPGNVMLDEKGRAKLVDFGIARFGGGRMSEDDALGTPYYASPEQVLRKTVDFRTDIYSLGATVFHALTGSPPFPGKVLKEVLAARLKTPAPNLKTLRPDLHPKTAAVVARMLEANPENRYASYEELRADLEDAYAEAAGLKAPIVHTPARGGGKWLLAVGAAAVIAAGVVVFVILRKPPAPPAQRPVAATKALAPTAARPVLAPAGRPIAQEIDVALSCDTAGAAIFYTLDGSEPTEASDRYSRSVRIVPGTTVKARAFVKGYQPSGVVAAVYPEDRSVLTDIVPLRTRANQAWTRVKDIDGAQGFKALIEAAATIRTDAEELYQKSAYGPAGEAYAKLASACEAIEKRQAARTAAQNAKAKLEAIIQSLGGLPKDGGASWKAVAAARVEADKLFETGAFDDAAARWGKGEATAQSLLRETAQSAAKRYQDQAAGYDMTNLKAFGGKAYQEAQTAAETAQKAMAQGDYLAAAANFEQARRLLPRAQASATLRQFTRQVQDKVDLATRQAKDQQLAESAATVEEILKLDPCQPEAWTLRNRMSARTAVTLPLDGNPASPTAIKMALIQAGSFEFGPSTGSHKVTLTRSFYMGQYEVTRGQFELFVKARQAADANYKPASERGAVMILKSGAWVPNKGKTPFTWLAPGFAQDANHPVTCVTWSEAEDFCKWAGEKSGATLRLPTEAEWEYACRAGTKTPFSFSPPSDLPLYGDYADKTLFPKTSVGEDRFANTAPVGTFKPNPWKLYDMHGNVMEWCQDWYQPGVSKTEKDPAGPESGVARVVRGGSWSNPPMECTSFFRRGLQPWAPSPVVGFRVVAIVVPDRIFAATPPTALPQPPPLPDVFVSELTPLAGSSKYRANLTVNGTSLKVAGQDYQQGFGVASPATLILPIKPAFRRFVAIAGLDGHHRAAVPAAAVRCRVFLDDVEVAATPILRYAAGGLTNWPFDVRIPEGVREIRLVVEDAAAPGANVSANVDWVNAGFRNDQP